MTTQPAFIVLLAAFNGRNFISEQLNSIFAQSGVRVHVFVSVDKSNDGTESFLADLQLKDPRLTLLPFGQYFGGAGPNFYRLLRDVDVTGFDYACFADQDDIWHPEKLWRAHCLMSEKGMHGYSSNVMAFWQDGKTKLIDKAQQQRQWDFLFEAAGPGCTYVMRQDLAFALQNLVRTRWDAVQAVALHDWLSYAFARANGYKWVIDSQVNMQYRQHASNQVGVNAGWRAFKYRVGKVLGGWGTDQAAKIANVLNLDETPFVRGWKSGGRLGMLWLAVKANQCRRRKRDRVFFAFSCAALAVLGRTHKP
jgi:rhamnosyltransferase